MGLLGMDLMPFWGNEAIFQVFWELGYLDQSRTWRRLFDADRSAVLPGIWPY
jgi:hypothetical protein